MAVLELFCVLAAKFTVCNGLYAVNNEASPAPYRDHLCLSPQIKSSTLGFYICFSASFIFFIN